MLFEILSLIAVRHRSRQQIGSGSGHTPPVP
jgi:hypothetical protein